MLRNHLFWDANGKERSCLAGASRKIATLLAQENRRTYIDNPRPDGHSHSSALTTPQYERVRSILAVALKC